jgi:hypothetical protein
MMLDLSKTFDLNKSDVYYQKLKDKGAKVELKEIGKTRGLKQNSYLHVCITLYAIHFGNTLEESKTDLKRECSFMRYNKNGNVYLKSTAKLTSKELTDFIEWIRNYSSVNGCYIPTSEEYLTNKFEIDRDINQNKQYL